MRGTDFVSELEAAVERPIGMPFLTAALANMASAPGQVKLHIPIGAIPKGRCHMSPRNRVSRLRLSTLIKACGNKCKFSRAW